MPETVSKTFRLPVELAAALERRRQEAGQTLTQTVIEVIEAGLVAGVDPEAMRKLYIEASRAKEILEQALKRMVTQEGKAVER